MAESEGAELAMQYAGYIDEADLDARGLRKVIRLADNETISGQTKTHMPAFSSTTPTDGQLWIYSSGNSQWEPSDGSFGKTVFYGHGQEANTITGTVTDEVCSISFDLAADDLNEVGRTLESEIYFKSQGGFSNAAVTIKWRLGGVVIEQLPSFNTTASGNEYGWINLLARVETAGATGDLFGGMTFGSFRKNGQFTPQAHTTSSSVDLTSALTVDLAISIDSPSNSITIQHFRTRVSKS